MPCIRLEANVYYSVYGLRLLFPMFMASRKSNSKTIRRMLYSVNRLPSSVFFFMFVLVCLNFTGCQRFPGGQAMRQYQLESDRLLAEFRAQKKRAEELEVRNGQLEQRLAESEKLLARSLGGSSSRSAAGNVNRSRSGSQLMIGDAREDRGTINDLSDLNSSRSSGRSPAKIQRGGLPDTLPSTSGQLTSGNRTDPFSLGRDPRDLRGDPKSESQWRPIYRGQ